MSESFEQFILTVTNELPPNLFNTGEIIRFGPKQRFWCVLFGNRQYGVVGDWRTGDKHTWSNRINCSAGRLKSRRSYEEERFKQKSQKRSQQKRAAIQVQKIWSTAKPAPIDFRYLKRKKIKPNEFRLNRDGRLLVPLQNVFGRLVNLQYISEEGLKRFHYRSEMTGVYSIIKQSKKISRILICEGVATGCTLSEIEPGSTVIAAMTAGNLTPVAKNVRRLHPHSSMVICGDNDRFTDGNPGKTKAIETAKAVGAKYAIPDFPVGVAGTDYNDLYCGSV